MADGRIHITLQLRTGEIILEQYIDSDTYPDLVIHKGVCYPRAGICDHRARYYRADQVLDLGREGAGHA